MDPFSYLQTSAVSQTGKDPTLAAEPALVCLQLHTQVHTLCVIPHACYQTQDIKAMCRKSIRDWLAG